MLFCAVSAEQICKYVDESLIVQHEDNGADDTQHAHDEIDVAGKIILLAFMNTVHDYCNGDYYKKYAEEQVGVEGKEHGNKEREERDHRGYRYDEPRQRELFHY